MSHKLLHLLFILIIALTITSTITFALRDKNPERQSADSSKTLDDYFTQSQSLKKNTLTEQETHTVTLLAVGDISLSRNIAQTIKIKQDPLYPFRGIEPLLQSTDFNFGNLETPFSKSDAFTPNNTLVFNAPKANVAGLKAYNFKVLNLANNHAFDQGLSGVLTTRKILADNNILFTGSGESLDEAWMPAVYETNGIKIGFIGASYSSINDGGKTTNNYVARIEDLDRLTAQVSFLKSQADFIVVTMHAGTEYTATPNEAQIKFAHAAVDAGADIVIGAHPHWVQEKELYCPISGSSPFKGEVRWDEHSQNSDAHPLHSDCKWIYYSLGNFIFDQSWSEQTKKGLALKITLSKTGTNSPTLSGAATLNDLQPAGGKERPETNLDIIEEIPIYIKGNCCPIIAPK